MAIPIGKSNTPLLQMNLCIVSFGEDLIWILELSISQGLLDDGCLRGVY